MDNSILAKRVTDLRKKLGWSRAEVARRMTALGEPTHPSHITGVEAGTKSMSPRKLLVLAEVLETNTGFLLGETDDPKPPSDLEDQVVAGVEDEKSRAVLQDIVDLMARQPYEEQRIAYDMLRRMFTPRTASQATSELMGAMREIMELLSDDPTAAGLVDRLVGAMPPDMRSSLRHR